MSHKKKIKNAKSTQNLLFIFFIDLDKLTTKSNNKNNQNLKCNDFYYFR